jgi:hypothetical protein
MRLLNTETLELQYFIPGHIPDYVILSHRWCTPNSEECTFEDISKTPISNPDSPARTKHGFSKIRGACDLAFRDNYQWIWIDSCCIDKSSSAELQEAINSMWNYYANSNICYVYMVDVLDSEPGRDQRFRQSEWFTRGWTLQELIAPVCVEFYARNWLMIGTKFERYKEIADITGIDRELLVRTQDADSFSASERLSWAAHRQVTREEDVAYSLLGLFDVNMPLIYREVREKAFTRLQEAIYNSTTDHSLFLFRYSLHHDHQPLLADSPSRFCDKTECALCISRGILCFPSNIPYIDVYPTIRWETQAHEKIMTTVTAFRNEMSTTLPLLDYQDISDKLVFFDNSDSRTRVTHVAVLNHSLKKYMDGALCLLLRRTDHAEVFQRLKCFPAILPNLAGHESSLEKTKMLICPGLSSSRQNRRVHTTFTVSGNLFLAQKWNSTARTSRSNLSVSGRTNTDFEIQTNKPQIPSKQSAKISCQIVDSRNGAVTMLLQLVRIGEIWSILKVFELTQGIRPRKKAALFHSFVVIDRLFRPILRWTRAVDCASTLARRSACSERLRLFAIPVSDRC